MRSERCKTKRTLKRSQDNGYSTIGAQISSAYSFVILAIFFAAPFHRSSKWLAARCLMASRFLVFFLFGVVLARPFFPNFLQWIPKRCKGVHCVDLGESFPTSIHGAYSDPTQFHWTSNKKKQRNIQRSQKKWKPDNRNLGIFILYSRDFSLQPPFADVLSGMLRAA